MPKKGVATGRDGVTKVKPLDDIDHKLLAALDKTPGITHKKLGELVGMSDTGVAKRYKKPAFQAALAEVNRDIWDLIIRGKKIAARNLIKLAGDSDKRIALEAAKLLFGPTLQDTNINIREIKEVIYRTKFGKAGELINEVEEIVGDPKDVLDLLGEAVKPNDE